jgi:hypothetical protein
MRCCVEHLVVIAGPTASGKSILIEEIRANRLSEVGTRLGIEDLQEWRCTHARSITKMTEPALKGLVLHWDFLWSPYRPSAKIHDGNGAWFDVLFDVLKGTREVSFVTLWTPPARLERQLIAGKLQQPVTGSTFELIKSTSFRCLPRSLIIWIARLPLWWLPRSLFKYTLNVLKVYTQPEQVVQVYRRWFQFCDQWVSKTRSHVILEFDEKLKFYSRDEWENMICSYESSAEAPGSCIP